MRRVFVYRNLTRGCWSVRDHATGRVISYLHHVYLVGATFRVSKAGRARVLSSGHKNVHAGVDGYLVPRDPTRPTEQVLLEVTYNPYISDTFRVRSSGDPILEAAEVWMTHPHVYIRRYVL